MEGGNINHKIRIHHIHSPSFMYNDILYYMESRMIKNFADIDSIIEQHLRYCEKNNLITEMAILSITNMHDEKPVMATTGEFIPFLRYKFFPSVEGQMPIPNKL